jgi:hypothetical protein
LAFNEDIQFSEAVPVVDTNAYQAGDCVGGLLEFSEAVIAEGGTARLHSVLVCDQAAQDAAMTLILFNDNPASSTFTNNAALSIHDDDIDKVIAAIAIAGADYVDAVAADFAQVVAERLIKLASGNNVLYGALVTSGTPTYTAADDLTVKLALERLYT